MKLEQLEPRTLYSVDPFSAGLTVVDASPDLGFPSDEDGIKPSLLSAETPSATQPQQLEIIFIDEATPNFQQLVDDLIKNSAQDREFEIITIGSKQNGIELISETLGQYSDVNAVHLISHGSDGNVNIGNTTLNQSTLSTYENAITNWRNAFSENGDLLIYGCNFSETEKGKSLGAKIASLANVDVASSDDKTGGDGVGGNWVLEQITGTVETPLPFSDQLQESYQRSLASSILVTTTADTVDAPSTASFDDLNNAPGADGKISLREAIIAANTQAGADTINLSTGTYGITITGGFSNPQESGDHDITSSITIQGVDSTQSIIEATGLSERVVEVHTNGVLTINDVTIKDGFSRVGAGMLNNGVLHAENTLFTNNNSQSRHGGGLYNTGSATIINSSFENNAGNAGGAIRNTSTGTLLLESSQIDGSNSSGFNGAGLYNEGTATIRQSEISNGVANSGAGIHQVAGTLTIEDSTLKDNAASANGAGIHIVNGSVNITGSTISGNSGNSGGGIFLDGGATLDLLNSTFSANTAVFHGGGLYNDSGTATVSFSTFAFNSANTGSAVYDRSGTVTIDNSIFSNSLGNQFNGVDIHGISVSSGYNIIESTNVGGSNIHPTDLVGFDPLLSPLAPNGGTTETHALTIGSPALDNADTTNSPTNDQRGLLRDVAPDIGAVEGISGAPVITSSITTNTYTENTNLIVDGSMAITDSDSLDFNGGTFTVANTGYSQTFDQIFIDSVGTGPGEIQLIGNTVLFEGVIIGTSTGGSGTTPLTVNLNAQATIPAVNALARSISFTIHSEDPSTNNRLLSYSLIDSDGGNSNVVDIQIDVIEINDAPVIFYQPKFVVINEIHYDNLGQDANETIEIAATAGTDLSGWSLELYNGTSNSTAIIYDTIMLSGIIPDEGNGAGALAFPALGLQNGARDGMALIDDNGAVVEFISYEGTLTPVNGTAAGIASSNINVSEGPGASDAESLQRTTLSSTSTWEWPSPSSFGSLNLTQSATAPSTQTIEEDSSLVFSVANKNEVQVSDPDTSTNLKITITPTFGTVALPSNPGLSLPAVQFTGTSASINSAIDGLIYTPNPNFNGTDTLNVLIEDQDPVNSLSDTLDIDIVVTPVNDAPSGTDKILTINEDSSSTITSTDFGFTDVADGNLFAAVTITTLPSSGILELAGTAVTAGQLISITDINNGDLVYTPAPDDNGTAYADFGFQVHDNGGTLNGGIDNDPTVNKITFDVVSVNDAPAGTSSTLSIVENSTLIFDAMSFGFTDPVDGDLLASVIISPPATGQLTLSSTPVSANQLISISDISSGNLQYTPVLNENGFNYASIDFRVVDDGGTANGGTNTDPVANTITVDVLSVNNAPGGSDSSITVNEDSQVTILPADFGFSDPADGDNFAAVTITTLPNNGALRLSGIPVTTGQLISISDISNNELLYIPDPDSFGTPYTTFTFQVHDDGGTANSGVDQDPTPNTITIDVSSVSDEPDGTDSTLTINEDSPYTLTRTDFGFSDPADNDSFTGITITNLPISGTLELANLPVTLTQTISISEIDLGDLVYIPALNAQGTTADRFDFRVNDSGNTLNGGINQDLIANRITFDITNINDAPSGADTTLTTNEDAPLTIKATDFGYSDPADGNNFAAVTITTLPADGWLELNGTPVTVGQVVSITSLSNNALVFKPDLDSFGAPYTTFTFQVHDDGGTANSGVDQDTTKNTITIDVDSVSDEPDGTDNTLTIDEDTPYPLARADFGFSDPADNDNFTGITITNLPLSGTLELASMPVTLAQTISVLDIDAGNLVYLPAANSQGTAADRFDFKVNDSGNTLNGGINQDLVPNRIIFDINNINDAPSGTDNTLTTSENTTLILQAADFGYSDPVENDNFAAVTVTTLPANGSLKLSGSAVTTGQIVSITDINNSELTFTPANAGSGTAYASFDFQVHDDGGTANGGTNLDQTPNSITVDVSSVNDEPKGTDNTLTTLENAPVVIQSTDFGFLDPVDNNNFAAVTITTLPTNGLLELNGTAVSTGQTIGITNINNGGLVFIPANGANGVAYTDFDFQVHDDGGIANGGIDQDQTPNTITINVDSVNDAPSGANNTLTTSEDSPIVLQDTDFGFTDLIDGDSFAAVTVTTLPANGTLTLAGVPVTAGQTISITNIVASELVFTPATNESGSGYANFAFQVHDNGGTANGGTDQDQTPNTITFHVDSVNDAPSGTNNTIATSEDTPMVLQSADFGFTDAIDGNFFAAVTVTTLPAKGTLTLAGVSVTAGQTISITDIVAGDFVFTPATNENGPAYTYFNFQVHDDGGTANGGIDQDQTPETITINVDSVNDAPSGANNTLTSGEDSPIVLQGADFGFTDAADGDFFAAVTVTTLPANGTLTLAGVAVTAGQTVSITNIIAGDLVFTPASNEYGASYADFNFQVHDDGGTTSGGTDQDQAANTITFNIDSVNDAPSGADNTLTTNESTPINLNGVDFGFSDPVDGNLFAAITVTSLPANGSLTLTGTPVTVGQIINTTQILSGDLVFTPLPNTSGSSYAQFDFQVHDDGGTANGGIDQDQTPNTITFNVESVNNAPSGTNNIRTSSEDSPLVLQATDFGFADAIDGHFFAAVTVTTLPTAGSLLLAGTPVTAAQTISITDIVGGNLVFTPAPNENGNNYTDFTFQVHDDGGTANGGIDIDQTPNTITINVTSINDAPAGSNNTLTTSEDTSITLQGTDFGFSDTADGNLFSAITVSILPANGTLSLAGTPVTAGQTINITEIIAGDLAFTPATNGNGAGYATFAFQVHDNGGTANGGIDKDQTPNTITFNVDSVNDAPDGFDNTLSTSEDTSLVFLPSDFGFSDPADNNNFAAITVTTLPGNGLLELNGTAVTAGQLISITHITNSELIFTPSSNENGTGYTDFEFQVHDNGGTINGGIDQDQVANKITIDVLNVNDPPDATSATFTLLEDQSRTITLGDLGYTDIADNNPFNKAIISSAPINGQLLNAGTPLGNGDTVTLAALNNGDIVFVPAANASGAAYDNFSFMVQDTGGVLNNGIDTDQTPETITFDVIPVSDEPSGTDGVISVNEDTQHVLDLTDFGFADNQEQTPDQLIAVEITQPPVTGSLTLNGATINANQIISSADITSSGLLYMPSPNTYGQAFDNFLFSVIDSGNTLNNGQNQDQTVNQILIDIKGVSDAPTGTDNLITINEDTPYTLDSADFGFSDTNDGDFFSAISVVDSTVNGSLTLKGNAVAVNQMISITDIANGELTFTPAANSQGNSISGFSFLVHDTGSTDNGGQNISVNTNTALFNILPVNDAPTGQNNVTQITDNTVLVLSAADFPFSDIENHSLQGIRLDSLPATGTLLLNGQALTEGAVVSATELDVGALVYYPVSNIATQDQLAFSVIDTGSTANGGNNTQETPANLTITTLTVNNAPLAADSHIAINEDSLYTFSTADFGFIDPEEQHEFSEVIITSIAGNGTLSLNNTPIAATAIVSTADINSELLEFTPASNTAGDAYATIAFKVRDDGGTANGGQDTSTPHTITIDVAEVNDTPAGSDIVIDINEKESHILGRSDFGFTDAQDNHDFLAVVISSLNTDGQLTLGQNPVSVGDSITVDDIDAGLLGYTPDANIQYNPGIHQIGFQVQDNGDPQYGPTLDQTENLITFELSLVNDSPALLNQGATFAEGSDNTITTTVLTAIDPDDPVQELLFTLQRVPEHGQLTVNGTTLQAGDFFTMQQLTNNEIKYSHNGSETSSDFFDFALTDGGEDGVAPISARFYIDITEVIDPIPALPDNNLTLSSGDSFDSALGDVLNTGQSSLLDGSLLGTGVFEIEVIQQPSYGTVTLNPDGTFLYQHDGSNSTTDYFTYRVTNDDGATATARVNIIAEPKIDSAIEQPAVTTFPAVTVPDNPAPGVSQQEPGNTLEVEQLSVIETENSDSSDNSEETALAGEALDGEQQTDQAGLISGEESLFSVSALESPTTGSYQTRILNNITYADYDLESSASILERDMLRSLDVRQHNVTGSIYLFEEDRNTNFSVSSVDLRFDMPTSLSETVNNKDFLRGLSRAQSDLEEADIQNKRRFEVGTDVAISVSISTTAGILAWLLRGGALFGSLMAATPLWSSIDPLRVTNVKGENEEVEKSEVEDMFK